VKEYYIPCLKKFLDGGFPPDQSIAVDVIFVVNSIQIQYIQKFTYLNFFSNSIYPKPKRINLQSNTLDFSRIKEQ